MAARGERTGLAVLRGPPVDCSGHGCARNRALFGAYCPGVRVLTIALAFRLRTWANSIAERCPGGFGPLNLVVSNDRWRGSSDRRGNRGPAGAIVARSAGSKRYRSDIQWQFPGGTGLPPGRDRDGRLRSQIIRLPTGRLPPNPGAERSASAGFEYHAWAVGRTYGCTRG